MLHRVGHFTAKNVPGGGGISSHDDVENPCPHYSPRLGGWGLQLTAALCVYVCVCVLMCTCLFILYYFLFLCMYLL